MKTIEDIKGALSEQISALDKERQEIAEKHAREQATRLLLEAEERLKRLAHMHAAEHKAIQEKIDKQEREEAERRRSVEARIALEKEQNIVTEAAQKQKEEAERLEQELINVAFVEEQNKKAAEDAKIAEPLWGQADDHEINVEHPEAPLNVAYPGEAVEGTGGLTPETPAMSPHLRHILRQAARND